MMETLPYTSPRLFQLWRYTVSHGQLLLRSTKSESENTRVDLLFKDVGSLSLDANIHGIVVEKDFSKCRAESNFYKISSSNFSGFVIASAFFYEVDGGEYFDPSAFEASLGLGL